MIKNAASSMTSSTFKRFGTKWALHGDHQSDGTTETTTRAWPQDEWASDDRSFNNIHSEVHIHDIFSVNVGSKTVGICLIFKISHGDEIHRSSWQLFTLATSANIQARHIDPI